MREIKFRAWHIERKKMYTVKNMMWKPNWVSVNSDDSIGINYLGGIQEYTLMQYTGLRDKNGTEIYEGDIVLFTYWWFDGNQADRQLKGSVLFIPDHASFGLDGVKNTEWIRHVGGKDESSDTAPFASWTFSPDDIEVIGNIYEHPELMEAV